MLDVFICEDNMLQRQKFEDIIKKFILIEELDMEVRVSTADPYELLSYVENAEKVQGIYFLDVDLNTDINGLELASRIRNLDTYSKIVFITTHSEMQTLTFEYMIETLQYIIKDDEEEIKEKIKVCLIHTYNHYLSTNNYQTEKVKLKVGNTFKIIDLEDFIFAETSSTPHKVKVYLKDSILYTYNSLKEIEEQSDKMKKIHKSYVINENNIKKIDKKTREIAMANGQKVYASRRYMKNL